MTTLNISLPESMRTFIEEQVHKGGYSTASEYIRHLIREEQERADHRRVGGTKTSSTDGKISPKK